MNKIHRSEIDGLRAVAVIPVLIFHSGIPLLSGGFVGVDIFFVISGYLISKIVLQEIKINTFSFKDFYIRRIRRIIPALLIVILFSLFFGYIFALPSQFEETARAAIAAIVSVSNIYYWNLSGYFSPAAEFMPLLHTWSLGVEEQFYILFPMFLVLCSKLKLNYRIIFVMGFLPLILVSIWLSYNKQSAAFYLLPARAWELSLGVLLALNVFPRVKNKLLEELLSIVGILSILASFFLINTSMTFPGWAAIIPCLGTALVIQYSSNNTLVKRALSFKPIVFIGLISYSLYLWHWPVIVFLRMYSADIKLSFSYVVCFAVVSFILAVASWKFVETPFRNKKLIGTKAMLITLGTVSSLILILSVGIISTKGVPSRLGADAERYLSASLDVDPLQSECSSLAGFSRKTECRFGQIKQQISYVIIGDSHAAAIRSAIANTNLFNERTGSLWWRGACPLLIGARTVPDSDHKACTNQKESTLEALAESPEITHVVLAGRWIPAMTGIAEEIGGSYRTYLTDDTSKELSATNTLSVFERAINKSARDIAEMGKTVIIIGSMPEAGFDVPSILALSAFNNKLAHAPKSEKLRDTRNMQADRIFSGIAKQNPGVYYIPIWDIFCSEYCDVMKEGVPIYRDDDHITYSASVNILAPILNEKIQQKKIE